MNDGRRPSLTADTSELHVVPVDRPALPPTFRRRAAGVAAGALVAASLPLIAGPASGATTVAPPALTVTTPQLITEGLSTPYSFTGRIQNPTDANGGVDHPRSLVDFTLSGARGLVASEVTLKYDAGGGNYQPVPLTDGANGTITGSFGPANGFDVPPGYDATTNFQVGIANGATSSGPDFLTLATSLDDISGTAPAALASAVNRVELADAGSTTLRVAVPTNIGLGGDPRDFTAQLDNGGAQMNSVRIDFKLAGVAGLSPDTVALSYQIPQGQSGAGSYAPISLTQDSDGTSLDGYFGPQDGFPLPMNYYAVTPFRIRVLTPVSPGTLTTTSTLVMRSGTGATGSSTPTSTKDTRNTVLARPILGFASPTTIINGGPPAALAVAAVNNTGSSFSAVQVDLSLRGPSALKAAQLKLERLDQASGSYQAVTLSDAADGSITASIPLQATLVSPGSAVANLRLSAVTGAPAADITTTATLDNGSAMPFIALAAPITRTTSLITVPGAPTLTAASPGSGSLSATFTAPSTTGNSAITSYVVTASAGGQVVTAIGTSSPITVSGLTNGTTYSVVVQAVNAAGTSAVSNAISAAPVAATLTSATVTLVTSQVFVKLGQPTTYSGIITRGNAPAPLGTPVVLTERYVDGKPVPVGIALTTAGGNYTFTARPLYIGEVTATALGASSASVSSRVILTYRLARAYAKRGRLTVNAETRPGFITSSSRQERVQILLVDTRGRQRAVLATVNAAQRKFFPGEAQGTNAISYTSSRALPKGTYRVVVKVIGTPVNTGASSSPISVRVA